MDIIAYKHRRTNMLRHRMPLICRNRATSLFEVIVATVIFSLVMAGMVGVFVAARRHIFHSRERMTGSEMGKLFLDPLQLSVRQDTWDTSSNALRTGTTSSSGSVNNTDYTAQSDITSVSGTTLRRARVRVNWTEFSP